MTKTTYAELEFAGKCCPEGWELVPSKALELLRKNYPEAWKVFYKEVGIQFLTNVHVTKSEE